MVRGHGPNIGDGAGAGGGVVDRFEERAHDHRQVVLVHHLLIMVLLLLWEDDGEPTGAL